jgi:hypothetical protein
MLAGATSQLHAYRFFPCGPHETVFDAVLEPPPFITVNVTV